ncbi:MAG TPA: HD domain-containing phosphohydrolase [Myxococcaceae bacterium]|nr:HD domain-containing phosphohydrolase [Myxococcaceae bacterium]
MPLPRTNFISRRELKLQSILEVAKAMTAERHLDQLLHLILAQATRVVEADRCSLFLLDREKNELWSKVAQGARGEIRVKLGSGLAGTVALTGEAINVPDAYADDRFEPSFDVTNGYRTGSLLCVPMRDASGEVTGVLQALNKKGGDSFTPEDAELLMALGGQAAVAIENAVLHDEISRLFEGFVQASVVAIESRDPTTAGHSGRVADLTVTLAQAMEHVTSGPYAQLRFRAHEIQEIRYASLLHDFGKVGVREPVLVKAEKLHPHELNGVRQRFEVARQHRHIASYQRRLEALKTRGLLALPEIEAQEMARLSAELAELDRLLELVLACNTPEVVAQRGFEQLDELRRHTYLDSRGEVRELLSSDEVKLLSIRRGSLSPEERTQIQQHVEYTFRFLKQIPWTRSLRNVPEIAYAHHERLNGRGYPRAIRGDEIPVQSKIMAICDIFDALTAADRPYKKAIPAAMAFDILRDEADAGLIDGDILRVFIEAEIPRRALGSR